MRLPAEWEKQSFVQLTLPHNNTDWSPILDDVLECYCEMIVVISKYEPLIIVAQDMDIAKSLTKGIENVHIIECNTNDTWARDHGFITCVEDGEFHYMDFQFNGWGLKYPSNFDNQINKLLWNSNLFIGQYVNHKDFVLEGGSIESDGNGTIITTSKCLLEYNRNSALSKTEIESKLKSYLGAERVLWLNHGHLSGDDTDGHIDTLARLCPNDTIVYVECNNPEDEHYEELSLMKEELSSFSTKTNHPYKLIGIPLPHPIYDDGYRLPATYANFLIINGAVLLPTYNQPTNDNIALQQLKSVFPERDIIGINCNTLIRQHGSLHCCTMQYPTII